ncbi:phospholipase D family protein [Pseudooceanicola sp. CBS1P-1]|uniref:Phospholipase D n=1 Tax=Pseudooceanicola albus TaxID=2692189 RepID=A0A6L7G2Q5_9RHOB|nr:MULTISPECIES: phospholipase D family protein [Pseudooceanicola]MBT9383826.1 phospholipase D family protein [Pseudooceanicola endophyticus]MXN17680.1 phospholipase D family protein [Pseudooceanicola albus]
MTTVVFLAGLIVALILGLRLRYPLPANAVRRGSRRMPISGRTALGARVLALMHHHPRRSGVHPLGDGREALAARVRLARAAEESLDLQYYIWKADTTGWLLLDELRAAAARGVRVRLLLDDNGVRGLDDVMSALDGLENVEVRLFNPYVLRRPRPLNYLFDFLRLNRRMHNKAMTADGAVTILGGRNIGDGYFAYGPGVHIFDFDVLAAGPAAEEAACTFDHYWASASAYPVARILKAGHPSGLDRLHAAAETARETLQGQDYVEAIRASAVVADLWEEEPALEWTRVTLYSDDPAKGTGVLADEKLLITTLSALLERARHSVDVTSAYFVPGPLGSRRLRGLAERGVRTRVLTNSLESTNVVSVHSAYMGYRTALLSAGVSLYELRAHPVFPHERLMRHALAGSTASLHAKTFVMDGERVFIGSFNFDPRSARLNTEMGFLIESPRLAGLLSRTLDLPATTYALSQSRPGRLTWRTRDGDGNEVLWHHEPNTRLINRLRTRVLRLLPMEWML